MNIQKIDEILHSEEMAEKFDEEMRIEFAISLATDDLRRLTDMFPNDDVWNIYDAIITAVMETNEKSSKGPELYEKTYKKVKERFRKHKKECIKNERHKKECTD